MAQVSTIGLDLAKNIFQVHGVDSEGKVVVRRSLRRAEVLPFFAKLASCLVGMEACGTAHHWARELIKLDHTVKMMPPAYVKPYVKRGKTDAADAEAIAEAVTRPTMRFVAVKTVDQQGVLMLHKVRDLLVRQRNMLTNALRGHLAELGIIAAQGRMGLKDLISQFHTEQVSLPALARAALRRLIQQIEEVADEVVKSEKGIVAWCRTDAASRRLITIPGIGPITASMISASVPDPALFQSGRQFAAWLGLTPKPRSSGGKERLGGISKQGDGTIRRLLVVGATAVIRTARRDNPGRSWAKRLLERKPARVVSVALANKTARIAWAVLARGEVYKAAAAA
ncbi:MAG: IS110 family transposase [Janthinobacterium lividum]